MLLNEGKKDKRKKKLLTDLFHNVLINKQNVHVPVVEFAFTKQSLNLYT